MTDWETIWAEREAQRAKDKRRREVPIDLELRELYPAKAGTCKWCGEAIYRVNKAGQVVRHHSRMWHEGREVHPDAQPEPECTREYFAQHFTFRDAVGAKDNYTCAECGLDCKAEMDAYVLEARAFEAWNDSVYDAENAVRSAEFDRRFAEDPDGDWRRGWWSAPNPWTRKGDRSAEWARRNPGAPAWHADHVIPLEDGGLHAVANGQVLCAPCHAAKTGRENAERAARQRGEVPTAQLELA